MSVYDRIAWLYEKHFSPALGAAYFSAIERAVLNGLPRGAAVLDLCCGAGALSVSLVGAGFDVVGIDSAEQMLEVARRRVPSALFVCADARSFNLDREFAAAFSTFDSLNHVLDPDDLRRVFESVARHLVPGGAFLFDLNTEAGLRERWCASSAVVEETRSGILRFSYDERTGLATCNVTAFTRDGDTWSREDVAIRERAYPHDDVATMLGNAGLRLTSSTEMRQLGGNDEGRLVYTCVRR